MVTALEPIMRACSGVWVAHGRGQGADPAQRWIDMTRSGFLPMILPTRCGRRMADPRSRNRVITTAFCNEGLWALCHLAYVRPGISRQRIGVTTKK